MKTRLIAYFISIFLGFISQKASSEEIERGRAQVSLWRNAVAKSKVWTDSEKLERLPLGLRNMWHWKSVPGYSDSAGKAYHEIQRVLLSIPNATEYFLEKIEIDTERFERLESMSGFDRIDGIATLGHLPGPESIKALGELLGDERGKTGSGDLSNAMLASHALARIGLRNASVPEMEALYNVDAVAKQRAWYAEVKEGKKSFSFAGQKHEYRFKPDGSWEIFPISTPPEDRERPIRSGLVREQPGGEPVAEKPQQEAEAHSVPTWAYVIGGFTMFLTAIWFWKTPGRKTRSGNGQNECPK